MADFLFPTSTPELVDKLRKTVTAINEEIAHPVDTREICLKLKRGFMKIPILFSQFFHIAYSLIPFFQTTSIANLGRGKTAQRARGRYRHPALDAGAAPFAADGIPAADRCLDGRLGYAAVRHTA